MSPALVPLAAALLAALPAARGARPHPRVEPRDPEACITCHAETTPAAVAEWEAGPHGLLLVKCFVCHGSTGDDFARRPDPRRCAGCHPDEARTAGAAKRSGEAGGCFSCHASHSLAAPGKRNPHAR